MQYTLGARLALTLWPLLRCRPARATTLLGLLGLVAMPLLFRAPAGVPPLNLPGMPVGLAVDAATHQLVLTTTDDNTVLTMDGPGAAMLGGLPFPNGNPETVAVDPIAGYVYVASTQSQIVVLASPISTPLATIELAETPIALAVNPATGRVYVATLRVSGVTTADLIVLDGPRLTTLAKLPLGRGSQRVAVDPTTSRVYVTDDGSNTLTVLDGASNAILVTLPLDPGHHELAVNARTGRVYVSSGTGHTLSVLDGSRPRLLDTVAVPGHPGVIAVNEQLDRVYVATDTGSVMVLDGRTDRLLAKVPVDRQPTGLAVDAATNRVYVNDPIDGTVWLLQDGRFGRPGVRLIAYSDRVGESTEHKHEQCGC